MATKKITAQQIIRQFEQSFPKSYAMDNDPIGLQVGTLNKKVTKIMIALDVDMRVCDEAIANGVDLIIAHHPMIYRPLQQVLTDTPKGRTIEKLLKHDICVYAAHTNLDIAPNGLNDWLAQAFALEQTKVLTPTQTLQLKKFVTYVPVECALQVRKALLAVNSYEQNGYRECSFMSSGEGSFFPMSQTTPNIGKREQCNYVQEMKIEMLILAKDEQAVIDVLHVVHPYEVPAFETYVVDQPGPVVGLGRIGELSSPTSIEAFITDVKSASNIPMLRGVGIKHGKKIRRVAVLGGSGSSYWQSAKRMGADVYITGDIGYHDAQDAIESGMMLLDVGHFTEHLYKQHMVKFIEQIIDEQNATVRVLEATCERDPFQFM